MKRWTWMLAAVVLLSACKTKERIVTVPEIHTEHHYHTDSIERVDTLIREKATTIMQLDSAQMAQYGIQLKNAERAWLIQSKELEQRIQQLQRMTADRDTVRDSVAVPYPVEVPVEVEKELTKWQQWRLHMGDVLIVVLGAGLVFGFLKLRKRLWP